MTEIAAASTKRVGVVMSVVVPSILTAVAFTVASRYGLVGDLPLWALLALLVAAGALGAVDGRARPARREHARTCTARSPRRSWECRRSSTRSVGGPTLTIGYVFVVSRALDAGAPGCGARRWAG